MPSGKIKRRIRYWQIPDIDNYLKSYFGGLETINIANHNHLILINVMETLQ